MGDLLKQFVAEECSPHVRRLLADAMDERGPSLHRLEFNRFEVTIKRDEDLVVLQDVLDATELGVERMTLAAFVAAL